MWVAWSRRSGPCRRSGARRRALAHGATGPFAWACDASRQVENFTDFGHFAFVHAGSSAIRATRLWPRTRCVSTAPSCATRTAARRTEHRRVPGVRRRGTEGRDPRTATPCTALHDRRASTGAAPDGLSIFASQPWRPIAASATAWCPQLQSRPADEVIRPSAHDLRPGPACGRIPAPRSRPLRPRRRAPPHLRRGRGRVSPRHARPQLQLTLANVR